MSCPSNILISAASALTVPIHNVNEDAVRLPLTVNLLLANQERQTANAREAINQTMESISRQYTRNVEGLVAQRDNRRNQLQSNINQAYNQIPSLGSVLLNVASTGLSNYGTFAKIA